MSVIGSNILAGASGGAEDALYVDDVYSTYAYEGTGSAQTITNGIDISGEGALVWIKSRTSAENHALFDTERGAGEYIQSNTNNSQTTSTARLSAFTSSGFTLGTDGGTNGSTNEYVSWTFRKAPGFFDVVTYEGTGSAQTIAHNLGCVPGFIAVKNIDDTGGRNWRVYHSGMGNNHTMYLNDDGLEFQNENTWNQTDPTSTHFTVGSEGDVNRNGDTHVAYIWADGSDAASAVFGTNGDEKIIKCGSYTGTSGTEEIDCGFEPQWVLIKKIGASFDDSWIIFDMMREWVVQDDSHDLRPDSNAVENTGAGRIHPTPTGFNAVSNDGTFGSSGYEYLYVAIRRPNKPPEAGTDVFSASTTASGSANSTGFNVDWAISKGRNGTSGYVATRLLGNDRYLLTNSTAEEASYSNGWAFDLSDSFVQSQISTNPLTYAFSRAAGFMDVATYEAASGDLTVNHNLGVTPEMVIVKGRNYASSWTTWHSGLSAGTGSTNYHINLNSTNAESSSANANFVSFSSTNFVVGNGRTSTNNTSVSGKYFAYLFATLSGISKVGSYSGTGDNVDVDCGFSAGARFILIKRRDSTGDWYLYNSTRGIVAGDDPYLLWNDSASEVTNTDYIDPLNAGFTVTSSAPAALNASGGTYIFLAIA